MALATNQNFTFKKGMRVVKIFHGTNGYREATIDTVARVAKGAVYVGEGSGITYSVSTGRELENFFPPFYCEITPLGE